MLSSLAAQPSARSRTLHFPCSVYSVSTYIRSLCGPNILHLAHLVHSCDEELNKNKSGLIDRMLWVGLGHGHKIGKHARAHIICSPLHYGYGLAGTSASIFDALGLKLWVTNRGGVQATQDEPIRLLAVMGDNRSTGPRPPSRSEDDNNIRY